MLGSKLLKVDEKHLYHKWVQNCCINYWHMMKKKAWFISHNWQSWKPSTITQARYAAAKYHYTGKIILWSSKVLSHRQDTKQPSTITQARYEAVRYYHTNKLWSSQVQVMKQPKLWSSPSYEAAHVMKQPSYEAAICTNISKCQNKILCLFQWYV